MKTWFKILSAGLLLLTISGTGLAVSVKNKSPAQAPAVEFIERGGMITSTQLERRIIAVDLKEYSLASDIALTSRSGKPVKLQELAQGTTIEFKTKRGLGGVEEIKTIEVVRFSR